MTISAFLRRKMHAIERWSDKTLAAYIFPSEVCGGVAQGDDDGHVYGSGCGVHPSRIGMIWDEEHQGWRFDH